MKCHVFVVSDRTGITAEALGRSLLTQFPSYQFTYTTLPFVDDRQKAERAAGRVRQAMETEGGPVLVFSTLVDPGLKAIIAGTRAHLVELFDTFIPPLEEVLGVNASRAVGRAHGVGDLSAYQRRIEAINFTLGHDDGVKTSDLTRSDVVLVGVSRSGKTPTCLYMAMQFSVRAANYPLTEEDIRQSLLPACLRPARDRLYGLTISAEQLSRIRQQRRPDSRYASMEQCRLEVARAESLFRQEGIPFLDTSAVSVEEIATNITHHYGLHRLL